MKCFTYGVWNRWSSSMSERAQRETDRRRERKKEVNKLPIRCILVPATIFSCQEQFVISNVRPRESIEFFIIIFPRHRHIVSVEINNNWAWELMWLCERAWAYLVFRYFTCAALLYKWRGILAFATTQSFLVVHSKTRRNVFFFSLYHCDHGLCGDR